MDSTDHRKHGVTEKEYQHMARQVGFQAYHNAPVSDYDEDLYFKSVFEAACVLSHLIHDQGHRVFVHCAAGVSRSNTLFLVYAGLFGFPNFDHKLFGLDVALQADQTYSQELG